MSVNCCAISYTFGDLSNCTDDPLCGNGDDDDSASSADSSSNSNILLLVSLGPPPLSIPPSRVSPSAAAKPIFPVIGKKERRLKYCYIIKY